MFATIVSLPWNPTVKVRSSFFDSLDDAIEYAKNNDGIEAVEDIGYGIAWRKQELHDV